MDFMQIASTVPLPRLNSTVLLFVKFSIRKNNPFYKRSIKSFSLLLFLILCQETSQYLFSFSSNVLKLNLYSLFSISGHFRKSLIKSPSGRLSILKINLLGCLFAIKTSMIEPILQSSFIAEKKHRKP